jgi:hypothetical protein
MSFMTLKLMPHIKESDIDLVAKESIKKDKLRSIISSKSSIGVKNG